MFYRLHSKYKYTHAVTLPVILIFLLTFKLLNAQTKFEKEIRIHESYIFPNATAFVQALNFKKVKWYKEIGLNKTISYEAKAQKNKKKYSIEFSSEGILEDVEIEIPFSRLSSPLMARIKGNLESAFEDYRIQKTQIQYIASPETLLDFLIKEIKSDELQIHYEIIVIGKTEELYNSYEYLFDSKGNLIKKLMIITKYPDYIDY